MTEVKKKPSRKLKIILPILILIIGFVAFNMLTKLKKAPHRQAPQQQGVLVDVIELETTDYQTVVHASGTVQATQEISLVPEVSGKVIWISPQLVSGGVFKRGELLLKIDPSNYQLAIEKAYAEIAQVQVALATERERAKVALSEWQRIEIADKGKPGPLVTREIQMQQQQANLAAAEANLKQAQLNLQRTKLRAPFNGRISQKQVDLGQYLRSGTGIGKFVGTDRVEINVPLPYSELQWLKIPPAGSREQGSAADIFLPGDNQPRWHGTIIRSLGEIDPTTRMETVVIAVNNPSQQSATLSYSGLSTGLFVNVQLKGKTLNQVITIPRKALRNNQRVWIVNSDNKLEIRRVAVARREKGNILVSEGLAPGEQVIITTLSAAANGMKLRPVKREQQQ
jgi:RND family efflux transporter MFP subunit